MRIDYKNPIVNMCCRYLSIPDFKKVLPVKLPSRDSIFSAVKGMIIWSRYLLKAVTSALVSADLIIQAKEQLKKKTTPTPTLTLNFLSIIVIGVKQRKIFFFFAKMTKTNKISV